MLIDHDERKSPEEKNAQIKKKKDALLEAMKSMVLRKPEQEIADALKNQLEDDPVVLLETTVYALFPELQTPGDTAPALPPDKMPAQLGPVISQANAA